MTRQIARAYVAAGAILVLFLAWAVISANPWSTTTASVDPKVAALHSREVAIRHQALVVRRVVNRRWAVYRVQLAHRKHEIALVQKKHKTLLASAAASAATSSASYSGPSASIVQLPALTVTRTS
jgi:hypothetical protein